MRASGWYLHRARPSVGASPRTCAHRPDPPRIFLHALLLHRHVNGHSAIRGHRWVVCPVVDIRRLHRAAWRAPEPGLTRLSRITGSPPIHVTRHQDTWNRRDVIAGAYHPYPSIAKPVTVRRRSYIPSLDSRVRAACRRRTNRGGEKKKKEKKLRRRLVGLKGTRESRERRRRGGGDKRGGETINGDDGKTEGETKSG